MVGKKGTEQIQSWLTVISDGALIITVVDHKDLFHFAVIQVV